MDSQYFTKSSQFHRENSESLPGAAFPCADVIVRVVGRVFFASAASLSVIFLFEVLAAVTDAILRGGSRRTTGSGGAEAVAAILATGAVGGLEAAVCEGPAFMVVVVDVLLTS